MSGVLISGATTPLGLEFVRQLQAEGRSPLLAVGREAPSYAEALLPAGVRYLAVDLTRPRHVRRLLFGPVAELGISSLVHLAAHRSAQSEGQRVHRLNVDATRLLLRLAEEHPTLTRFVHRSTVYVYANRTDKPGVLREDAPLELAPAAPQWVRDRVEADITVCARMGMTPLHVMVLRCAEVLAPHMGSQLYDYLQSKVCLRPLGFDPMIGLSSVEDAARALRLALDAPQQGVFNVPGKDALPLSEVIRLWGRDELPLPGWLLGPAYRARSMVNVGTFRYDVNWWRFHFSAVLDGDRAARELGYVPEVGVDWPVGRRLT
jgi:UDP-glucose 4-epimerase